jgi:hypothetical protein
MIDPTHTVTRDELHHPAGRDLYADPWLSLMSLGLDAGMTADAFMKLVRDSERLISRPSRETLR